MTWCTYFLGTWQFSREMDNGCHTEGLVTCTEKTPHRLIFKEEGTLTLESGQQLPAANTYLIEADKTSLSFLFEDGRLFQRFEMMPETIGTEVTSHHHCVPDDYTSVFSVQDENTFTLKHTVSGPKKAYMMMTRYTRQIDKKTSS